MSVASVVLVASMAVLVPDRGLTDDDDGDSVIAIATEGDELCSRSFEPELISPIKQHKSSQYYISEFLVFFAISLLSSLERHIHGKLAVR